MCSTVAARVALLLLRPHLRVPAEGPGGQDLGDLIPLAQAPHPPRDEAVREHGPDGAPAERDVVVLQEPLEALGDLAPIDAAEDALGEAGGLDDPEALQDRGLRGHQLQQEGLGLRDVPQPAALPRPEQLVAPRVRMLLIRELVGHRGKKGWPGTTPRLYSSPSSPASSQPVHSSSGCGGLLLSKRWHYLLRTDYIPGPFSMHF